jgi:chorismate mutase
MPTTRVRAIRGAIAIEHDTPDAIHEATATLVREIVRRNQLEIDQIISAVFTSTPDLTSAFPALAAREGWQAVPLLCATEIAVPGSLPMCIRILVHVERPARLGAVEHVYLGAAAVLRPDLHSAGSQHRH